MLYVHPPRRKHYYKVYGPMTAPRYFTTIPEAIKWGKENVGRAYQSRTYHDREEYFGLLTIYDIRRLGL